MRAVYRREMIGYFYTPAAYVFMFVFLAISSVFFGIGNLAARSSDLMMFTAYQSYLWIFLSPLLTMRLLAGEKSRNTDKMLFSSPCSLTGIVTGKFLAAVSVLALTMLVTVIYWILIAVYGRLYAAETAVAALGLFLNGCAFLSMDLFVSCFAKSQMTAVVLGLGVNLLAWFADLLADAVTLDAVADVLSFFSLYRRFEPFTRGLLSLSNLLFGVLFVAVMLFLSVRVLDARRWSEA